MKDLKEILAELANNDSFRELPIETETFNSEPDSLFSGFPDGLDQFHSLGRVKRIPKKQSDQEFEKEILSKIDILNDALFEHKADIDIVKNAHTQIGDSIKDLSVIITNKNAEQYQRANSKFQLLGEIYHQLDVAITGAKTRKLKNPDVEITQPQIVLLFHHLQQLGIVSKSVSNTSLATSLSELTGFSFEQIRQALSSVSVYSKNIDADFKQTDYSALNRKVKALQQNLETESSKRFK